MIMNLPNVLSLSRVFAVPLLLLAFYAPLLLAGTDFASAAERWNMPLCALIFVLAAVTDVLDGYFARRASQVTRFGAFIDPISDKIVTAVALIIITERAADWAVTLPAMVIITREIAVAGLREWMAELGRSGSVAVSWAGKIKTGLQMTAITFLLLEIPVAGFPTIETGLTLLYAAAVLTLWSMCSYLLKAKRSLGK